MFDKLLSEFSVLSIFEIKPKIDFYRQPTDKRFVHSNCFEFTSFQN